MQLGFPLKSVFQSRVVIRPKKMEVLRKIGLDDSITQPEIVRAIATAGRSKHEAVTFCEITKRSLLYVGMI